MLGGYSVFSLEDMCGGFVHTGFVYNGLVRFGDVVSRMMGFEPRSGDPVGFHRTIYCVEKTIAS